MDAIVLITPLVILALIVVLGFTGCEFDPQPALPPLTLQVRVPAQLEVVFAGFQWTRPGSQVTETVTTLTRTDDGSGTIVLSHTIGSPLPLQTGTWVITCQVRARAEPLRTRTRPPRASSWTSKRRAAT